MWVLADADSYLKWGVTRALEAQESWDVRLVIVDSAVTPSSEQVSAAVDGRWPEAPEVVSFSDVQRQLVADPPEALLLACRGPLVELVVRVLSQEVARPPVTVCGIPGIWMPPTALGLRLRQGVDVMVVHSQRERRAAAELSQTTGGPSGYALASLGPVLAEPYREPVQTVVFASQALVPVTVEQRQAMVTALVTVARAHPEVAVVIKERGRQGEEQTHRDIRPYPQILEALGGGPENLTVGYGPMRDYLEPGAALVTVSSTAVLEAIASGIPALCLDDFGVSVENINVVFEGSGLSGSFDDLERLDFRWPRDEWVRDNYFHEPAANDWLRALEDAADGSARACRADGQGDRGALHRAARRRTALGSRDVWWRRPATWIAAAIVAGWQIVVGRRP